MGPIPFTGSNEEFSVDITEEEVASLMDANGDIRFKTVLEWTLPTFGHDNHLNLWDWQAARIRNYMLYIIEYKWYTPKYYNPVEDLVIIGNHVYRIYGMMSMGRMQSGNSPIKDLWSHDLYVALGRGVN
ncbi:hypothetical protein ACHAXR_001059 [Thalassiosira sp. AJA248-18]